MNELNESIPGLEHLDPGPIRILLLQWLWYDQRNLAFMHLLKLICGDARLRSKDVLVRYSLCFIQNLSPAILAGCFYAYNEQL